MYSGFKYLIKLIIDSEANNNKLSGGFPHSEILGSKPILGSPKLIAEYHVLHRLLLPRHPPNALLALDPIRKETDIFMSPRAALVRRRPFSRIRKHTIPRPSVSCALRSRLKGTWLVYLTWTTIARFGPGYGYGRLTQQTPCPPLARGETGRDVPHTRGHQAMLIVSLFTISSVVRLDGQALRTALADPIGYGGWWSLSGSNR